MGTAASFGSGVSFCSTSGAGVASCEETSVGASVFAGAQQNLALKQQELQIGQVLLQPLLESSQVSLQQLSLPQLGAPLGTHLIVTTWVISMKPA